MIKFFTKRFCKYDCIDSLVDEMQKLDNKSDYILACDKKWLNRIFQKNFFYNKYYNSNNNTLFDIYCFDALHFLPNLSLFKKDDYIKLCRKVIESRIELKGDTTKHS